MCKTTTTTSLTATTSLTIQKTGLLIKSLLDVKKDSQEDDFPHEIQSLINGFVESQTKFIQGIDKYLHEWDDDDETSDFDCDLDYDHNQNHDHNDDTHDHNPDTSSDNTIKPIDIEKQRRDAVKVETVTAIIKTCPEFLLTKDKNGLLPIHCAAVDLISSRSIYVPLLARIGSNHGIGGKDGRGGLLVEFDNGMNVIMYLARSDDDIRTMQILLDLNLLQKDDVYSYNLIHRSAFNNYDMAQMMIELDPSCIYKCNDYGDIPILYICNFYFAEDDDYYWEFYGTKKKQFAFNMFQLLLQKAVKYDPKHDSVGGLFAKRRNGDIGLNCIITKLGVKRGLLCIQQALSCYNHYDMPILHQTITHAPQHYFNILERFPDSIFIRNQQNRLPIHVALEEGKFKWSKELLSLIHSSYKYLHDNDPVTNMPLYAMAAIESRCDLRTIYYLVRKHPEM